jgi:hypothetical protein
MNTMSMFSYFIALFQGTRHVTGQPGGALAPKRLPHFAILAKCKKDSNNAELQPNIDE